MQQLKGIVRDRLGTHASRQLRRDGLVPGVVYGHGETNVSFTVTRHDLDLLLSHGEHLVELDVDGKRDTCLIKAVQRDAFQHVVVHLDLARVDLNETVQVTVPVVLRGTPKGEVQGGVLIPGAAALTVECVVTNIPEEIRVNVRDLDVGDVMRVRDLPPLEGGRIVTNPDVVVVSCSIVLEAEVAPAVEGEEPVEPELIRREAEEEEPTEEEKKK